MRRRIWTFIRQADLIFSFQVGLPSMIRSGDCDTELPRNIEDDDFDEGSATLPPPKPNGVLTPVSYLIAKASVSFVLGKIVECTQTVHATSYEEVGELDKELRATYHGLCPLLHVKAFEDSTQDPVTTLMKRINLSMLFNKSLCVLHRRFLNRAHDNSRYSESRRACIDASMELLRTQQLLFWESKPGKRLHRASWYFGTLTTHDFILAGTLVCLDLYFSAQAESVGRTSGDVEMWGTSRRDEMITMIEASRDIWNDQKDRMMEAFKAFHILNVMLEKINTMRAQHAARLAQGAFSYAAPGSQSSQYSPPQDDEKPEHSAAITLGMLSSGGLSTGPFPPTPTSNSTATMTDVPSTGLTPNFAMEQAQAAGQSPFNNFFSGASVEAPINLDWVQNRQFPDANAFYPAQFHNAPFHPPPFIQTSASHFPLTPTVYQSRIYRPDLTSPLGIAILNQTYDRLAYLVSNSESQSAWDQYMQSSSNEQAQEMWSAVDPVQPSLDLQDPNGNGQQQQLNSNLFANNPSFLPPGTTL